MAARRALDLAMDLAAAPTIAGAMRDQPLPPGILALLRIAAGDPKACHEAAAAAGVSPDALREAAALYIQQVLLNPEADDYRVLGVNRDTPQYLVRQHMRWLMEWLHPDRAGSEWESIYAGRVLAAWQTLSSPERRARYERSLRQSHRSQKRRTRGRPRRRIPLIPVPAHFPRPTPLLRGWPIVGMAIVAALVLAAVLQPEPNALFGWKTPFATATGTPWPITTQSATGTDRSAAKPQPTPR